MGGVFAKAPRSIPASRNRRRGSGITKRRGQVTVFYGNITNMSNKAEDRLAQLNADAWVAGETHLKDEPLLNCARRLEKAEWNLTAAPAVQSSQSANGTWGGALCATKAGVAAQKLLMDKMMTTKSAVTEAPDLAMRVLNVMGGDILLIGGYTRGGRSDQQVGSVIEATRGGELPFIWMADFNEDPEEVMQQHWVRGLKAMVIRPSNAEVTCYHRGGSAVDFAVVSLKVADYFKSFRAVAEVPWGPHVGLTLVMNRDPRAAMMRTYRRPRPIQEADKYEGRGAPFETKWEEAKAIAGREERNRGKDWCQHAALEPQRRWHGTWALPRKLRTWAANWKPGPELWKCKRWQGAGSSTTTLRLKNSREGRSRW